MALRNDEGGLKAVLEVSGHGGRSFAFEFNNGLEVNTQLTKSFLMSERGQYLSEIWDTLADLTPLPETGSEMRAGYHIDGGAGTREEVLSFQSGKSGDDIRWGDLSSDRTDPNDITQFDASGANVDKNDRKQVYDFVLATTKTDSSNLAWLHVGQWSSGKFGEEGVFGRAIPCVIREANCNTDTGDPSMVEGSFTAIHATGFPADLSPGNITDGAMDQLNELLDYA